MGGNGSGRRKKDLYMIRKEIQSSKTFNSTFVKEIMKSRGIPRSKVGKVYNKYVKNIYKGRHIKSNIQL